MAGEEAVEDRLPDGAVAVDTGPDPDRAPASDDGSIRTSRSPEPTTPTWARLATGRVAG